jgi:hypothetical protein
MRPRSGRRTFPEVGDSAQPAAPGRSAGRPRGPQAYLPVMLRRCSTLYSFASRSWS